MSALSNDPTRCEVINLGWASSGHGPFLIRQEGHAPGGEGFQSQHYILQKDGRWLLNLKYGMLSEQEQENALFHHLPEVMSLLDRICSLPVQADARLPANCNPSEILASFERCTHRILKGMRSGTVSPLHSQTSS